MEENRSSLTEKEIGYIIDNQFQIAQEALDLRVNYNKEFQKVISNSQISQLFQAELNFEKNFLK